MVGSVVHNLSSVSGAKIGQFWITIFIIESDCDSNVIIFEIFIEIHTALCYNNGKN